MQRVIAIGLIATASMAGLACEGEKTPAKTASVEKSKSQSAGEEAPANVESEAEKERRAALQLDQVYHRASLAIATNKTRRQWEADGKPPAEIFEKAGRIDPWGGEVQVTLTYDDGPRHLFEVRSLGPDGVRSFDDLIMRDRKFRVFRQIESQPETR